MQEIYKDEEWRDIPGYEGIYQVSDLGRVKSLSRDIKRRGSSIMKSKTVILKSKIDSRGYVFHKLRINNCSKYIRLHIIVAMAFLGHKPDGTMKVVIDHKDNNKLNNKPSNLQLISQRENSSKDRKGGTSKYVGVCLDKSNNLWLSNIFIMGKNYYLGSSKDEDSANILYKTALENINLFDGDIKNFKNMLYLKLGIYKRPYKVIDNNTGIIYNSLKEISASLNVPIKILQYCCKVEKRYRKTQHSYINVKYLKNNEQ